MTDFLIEELRKAVRSYNRKPLIVCGAGVSTQATNGTAPGWAKLIQSGIKRVADIDANAGLWATDSQQKLTTGGTEVWIAIADEVTERLGGAHNREFGDWLQDELGSLQPDRRDLLDAICALGCPIATTTYDDMISNALGLTAISWSDHAETLRFLHDATPQGVLHLHGHWRAPERVVLGSTSYGEHSADHRRQLLQQIATLERPTLFIGCSQDGLADPDFSRLDSFLTEWQDVAPRRYWLIRQEIDEHRSPKPVPSPIHSKRLFPVAFGTKYDDLTSLLCSLPLRPTPMQATDPDAMFRCIDQHEPKPEIFGRDNELELIVSALLAGKPAIVAGGPGMGKTAVATAALYDPRIIAHFHRRRVFASLETATEPRAILAKLVEALGLAPMGDEVSLLRILETSCAERPIAAILDNAETVFEVNRGDAERLLSLAAQIEGLSLVVTIRGAAPHINGAISIGDLPKLTHDAARAAFVAIAGTEFATDADLPYLLEALDGHALSIHLIAAQANGLPALKGLRERWDTAHAEMLRRPGEKESRLTSVRTSLALSLGNPRMKAAPLARRLLGLLGLLPGGLAEPDVPFLLGDRGAVNKAKASEAITCLHQLRLVEHRPDRRLRMLTPLRECVRREVKPMPADRNRLIGRYLSIATKARKIGHSDWHQVRELVEAEGDNLDPICELAVESIISRSDVDGALIGLSEFHRFTGSASVKSLVRAVGRLGGRSPRRVGAYLLHLGAIALCRSDHQTATSRFKTALVFFQKDRDEQGRADCTYSLGTVARNLLQYGTATDRYEEAIKLYRRNFHGKANCIFGLGGIAMRRSDHATALARFSEALALYQDTNDEQGEGNCIQLIGRIALERSDQATAAAKFHEALALFQRIGSAQSAATCILDLGEVATQCSDQESAKIQFDAALALFRHYGNVQAEANCIRRLGIIALRSSDHGSAAARFDASLALYQKSEDQSGVAEALIRRGQARIGAGGIAQGIADIESGFGLYFRIADTEDRAFGGWQALHRALICENPAEAAKHLKKAETLWTLIGRIDLVQDWLTPIP